jgi:hypothetical protein
MANSVTFISPDAGILVVPTTTTWVFDIFDDASPADPARQATVSVNGIVKLIRVGGVTTFLDPGYTAVISTPQPNTERITFTSLTNWTDPSTILVNVNYAPDGNPVSSYDTFRFIICATFTLIGTSPADGESVVLPRSNISYSASSTATIWNHTSSINGQIAFSSPAFNKPNFSGTVTASGSFFAITIDPRREFEPGETVIVDMTFGLTTDALRFTYQTRQVTFFIKERFTPVPRTFYKPTRVDEPFTDYTASEAIRQALRTAIRARAISPNTALLLYNRIQRSSLKSQLYVEQLAKEAPKLLLEDQIDVDQVDAALVPVSILWPVALEEAKALGVREELLAAIAKLQSSQFPQERVAAYCALVFSESVLLS